MYYSHDGAWWWLMAITSTVFWLAFVAGVVALVLYALRSAERTTQIQQSSARAILDERFARGEITADEYQERLRLIESRSR
jgi:putative membrane protein